MNASAQRAAKRPGRPSGELPGWAGLLARRIRHLVDLAHAGNLSDASRLTGVSYPTLHAMASGRLANPSLKTLEAIRVCYGLELNWFTAPEVGVVPIVGRVGLVPPAPGGPAKHRALREVLLPYAAWPMFVVYETLAQHLGSQPGTPERPVVGSATGDAFTFRLTTFLLQPLLAVEKLGAEVVLSQDQWQAATQPGPRQQWVARLQCLGEMWLCTTPTLLTESRYR